MYDYPRGGRGVLTAFTQYAKQDATCSSCLQSGPTGSPNAGKLLMVMLRPICSWNRLRQCYAGRHAARTDAARFRFRMLEGFSGNMQIAVSTRSDTWCGQLRGSVGGRDCLITVVSLLRAWTNYCLLVCAQSSGVPASRPRRPGASGSAAARHGHSRGLERSVVPGSLSVEGGPGGLVRRRRAAASPARWDDTKTGRRRAPGAGPGWTPVSQSLQCH